MFTYSVSDLFKIVLVLWYLTASLRLHHHVTFRNFSCYTALTLIMLNYSDFNSSQAREPNHSMLLQFCVAKKEKSAALDSFQQLEIQAITFYISDVPHWVHTSQKSVSTQIIHACEARSPTTRIMSSGMGRQIEVNHAPTSIIILRSECGPSRRHKYQPGK